MSRALVNLSSLSISRFISMAAGALLAILAGRILGPDAFGQYALVFVLIGYFGVLIDFGMSTTVVRGIAAGYYSAAEIIWSVIAFRCLLFVVAACGMLLIGGLWKSEIIVPIVVGIGIMFAESMYGGGDAALRGCQEMVWLSITEAVFSLSRLALGALVLFLGYGLAPFLLSILSATLIKMVLVGVFFRKVVRQPLMPPAAHNILRIFKESRSIAAWQVLSILYIQMNVPVISFIKGDAAAGHFRASSSFVDLPVSFVAILVSVLLPLVSSLAASNPKKLPVAIAHMLKLSTSGFFPVYLCVAGFGPMILLLLFGHKYEESAPLLPILFAGVFTSVILGLLALVYIVLHRQHLAMKFTIGMVAAKGLALIFLGPHLPLEGVCFIIVLADVCNAVLHFFGLRAVISLSKVITQQVLVAMGIGLIVVVTFFAIPVESLQTRFAYVAAGLLIEFVVLQSFGVVDFFNIKKELRLP